VIAVGLALLIFEAPVSAQPPIDTEQARSLYERGLDAFKKQDYIGAIAALEESYRLYPTPNTLFAWAQAERLNDNCDAAVRLYRKFLQENAKLEQSQLVRENLALCEEQITTAENAPSGETERAGTAPLRRSTPTPTTTTTPAPAAGADRRSQTPVLQLGLVIAGAAGLGTSTGLFIASRANRNGAEAAGSLEDHDRLNDRADFQQALAFIIGAGSVALIASGTLWALLADEDEPESSTVTVGPTAGRGMIVQLTSPF
jgi:tetratricopeptide (TPR) repeat protein